MSRMLLIAEKPSLMREIKRVYMGMHSRDSIDFTCFAGHIISRCTPDEYGNKWADKPWSFDQLPILPEEYKFKVSEDKKKMFSDLKKLITQGKYDYIINACDPDREGQAIFQYFYDYIKCKIPVKRFWTNDLTDASIEKALNNLRTYSDGNKPDLKLLTESAMLRGEMDWDIGMNFSRAGSLAYGRPAYLGRVKTAVLKIAAIRELELTNFKPITTYEVEAEFAQKFKGTLIDNEGAVRFKTKSEAEQIIKNLTKKNEVVNYESKTVKTEAPQLFKLSTLQKEAGKAFGLSVEQVKDIAQSLYEKKIISYPRTDNPYVGSAIAKQFPALLKSCSYISSLKPFVDKITSTDIARVSKSSKYVDDKKMAESGHYAIIPTINSGIAFNKLSPNEVNVLTLIYTRFLAIFLPAKEDIKTTIISKDGEYLFKSTGTKVKSLGYLELYSYTPNEIILPKVKKGDILDVSKYNVVDKVSTPPSRYTDGSLIEVMDNPIKFLEKSEYKDILKKTKGIGTEATRAGIITELVKNGYIEIKKKGKSNFIYTTPLGLDLIEKLQNFQLTQVDLTAIWESKLEEIALGNITPDNFRKEEKKFILEGIDYLKTIKKSSISSSGNKSGKSKIEYMKEVCPKCGKPIKVTDKYYLCDEYKKSCDFIIGKTHFGAKINKTDIKKLLKGDNIEKKFTWSSGKKSKAKAKLENGKIKFLF